jgi:hypothetical protein
MILVQNKLLPADKTAEMMALNTNYDLSADKALKSLPQF